MYKLWNLTLEGLCLWGDAVFLPSGKAHSRLAGLLGNPKADPGEVLVSEG